MSHEDEVKAALKDALKEWMDEKFATFGRWSLMALAVWGLGAFTYFLLWTNGWQHAGR